MDQDYYNTILDNYKSLIFSELVYWPISILLIIGNIICIINDDSSENITCSTFSILIQLIIIVYLPLLTKDTFNYNIICQHKINIFKFKITIVAASAWISFNEWNNIYRAVVYYLICIDLIYACLTALDLHKSRYQRHPLYDITGEQRYLKCCLLVNIVTDFAFVITLVTYNITMNIIENHDLEDFTVVTTLTMTVTSGLYLVFDCMVWCKFRNTDIMTYYTILAWYSSAGICTMALVLGNLKSANHLIVIITAIKIADSLYKFITYWLYHLYFISTTLNDYIAGNMPINVIQSV